MKKSVKLILILIGLLLVAFVLLFQPLMLILHRIPETTSLPEKYDKRTAFFYKDAHKKWPARYHTDIVVLPKITQAFPGVKIMLDPPGGGATRLPMPFYFGFEIEDRKKVDEKFMIMVDDLSVSDGRQVFNLTCQSCEPGNTFFVESIANNIVNKEGHFQNKAPIPFRDFLELRFFIRHENYPKSLFVKY